MKTRNVALLSGDEVINVIVVEEGERGSEFLFGPYGPTVEAIDAKSGQTVMIRPTCVDVTDLSPGKSPGIGWRLSGERGEALKKQLSDATEKGGEDLLAMSRDSGAKLEIADDGWQFTAPVVEEPTPDK